MKKDENLRWMRRALEVARDGWGLSRPNPSVGAVVVSEGAEIACGVSQPISQGGAHAEVVAIRNAEKRTSGATLYVTLEPCSHWGKTPPCTEAIVQAGFSKVVIGTKDLNPLVNGKGIAQLQEAGIEVAFETLNREIEKLYHPFFFWSQTRLPWVTLKLAQTAEGFIAREDGQPLTITGGEAQQWAHQLRAVADAIVVSARTVRHDHPRLDLRASFWSPPQKPARIVLGRSIDFSPDEPLFQNCGRIILAGRHYAEQLPSSAERWSIAEERLDLSFSALRKRAGEEGMHHLLVETGAEWIETLLAAGEFNRLILLKSKAFAERGLRWSPGLEWARTHLKIARFAPVGDDDLYDFRPV